MTGGREPWVLELEEGQWRGEPPRGRLSMRVLGVSRSTVRGWATVSGWRRFDNQSEPRFVRVLVRSDLVAAKRGGWR